MLVWRLLKLMYVAVCTTNRQASWQTEIQIPICPDNQHWYRNGHILTAIDKAL